MNAVPKLVNKHIVRITEGGQLRSFAVSKDEFLIGRDEKSDIRLTNSDISSKHLYVKIIDGLMISLRDPGSTNGTFVGGERLPAGKECILDSLSDEIMLGKVARVSITPAALQPSAPKTSSRLALIKEKDPPSPASSAKSEPATPSDAAEVEEPSLQLERGTITDLVKRAPGEPDRYELDIKPKAREDDDQPDRVVISEEASRFLLRPERNTPEAAPAPEPRALPRAEPASGSAAHLDESEFTEEEAQAAQAAAMAEEAAKAAAAAQQAAKAAVAAHEKAKASAAARERAKADKLKAEAEAREKSKLDAFERERAKAAAAADAAREKVKAAAAAEEAAKEAKIAHDKAKAEAYAQDAAATTQSINDAARAEIAAFKKKAILDIEVVQMEAISFSELIKQEGHKDADALREKGRREADALKEETKRENERLKELAAREAESLKEDARRQGEMTREDARRDADALKDEGRRAADTLREDGRRDTDLLKAQGKKEIETLQYEGEKLKSDVDRIRSELERLQIENDRLRADGDKLRVEYRDESGKLTLLRQETESLAKIAEVQKTQAESTLREISLRRDGLVQECDQTRQRVLEAATLRDSLAKERSELEIKILDSKKAADRVQTDSQAELDNIKHQIERETREHATATARLSEVKQALRVDEDALKILQETTRREKELFDADERRRKALYDALDAEYRVKRLSVEALLGEAELKRTDIERECQKLKVQQADLEQHLLKLKTDAEAHAAQALEDIRVIEKDAQKAREKMDRFRQEGERLQEGIRDQEGAFQLLKKKTEETKKETLAAQETCRQAQQASAEARQNTEKEIAQVRAIVEQEGKKAREQIDIEVAMMREAAHDETTREIQRRKETLKSEFVDRGKAMERELADAKLRELKIIQGLQEEEKKALRTRMQATLEELVHKTIELARQKPLEHSKNELRETLKAVLEGKSSGTLSVEADERSKKYFKKIAIRASIPAGVIIFFALFPGLPGALRERFSRTVASEKNDSGVFLDQIKQRGLKFQPEMDRSYRGTYSDNILYVENYVEMKLSEKEQKEWTLVLNDFIVGRLGLSDRIIPDFISAESVMVQDLMHIREGILPQFKDQGLARMAETEKAASERLINLLQSPENFQRFRLFEKDYYDNYIKRLKAAK